MTKVNRPYKTRLEWVAIIKDKEDNNLTLEQVTTMYNVTEASYIKWVAVFKKEKENLPITEIDVIKLIEKSLVEFDLNVNRIDEQTKSLAEARKDVLKKKAKLQESLKVLKAIK